MVVKFTFQSVFGNSLQNPRHFSARGREESLELYSVLWSDWPTSKQKGIRHGNRFAARVRRSYFSEQWPEMRLLFAGYHLTATAGSIIWKEQRAKDGFVVSYHVLLSHHRRAGSRDFSRAWHLRNNMPCICGIICERKITICRSLFRSERYFVMQHKRGEILAWKVYLQFILGLILDKPVLTACMRAK